MSAGGKGNYAELILSPLSADVNAGKVITEPPEKDKQDLLQSQIEGIKKDMLEKKNDGRNASRLVDLYTLTSSRNEKAAVDERMNVRQMINRYIVSYKQQIQKQGLEKLVNDTSRAVVSERILGEVSMILDVDASMQGYDYAGALVKIEQHDSFIRNSDNRRELLVLRVTALAETGKYGQALQVLEELKEEVKKTDDAVKGYMPPDYKDLELFVKDLAGIADGRSDRQMDNEEENTESISIPQEFELGQNYPNPFNPSTAIPLSLPDNSTVTIKVYNILGQLVSTVIDQKLVSAGKHNFLFTGNNLATGMYIINAQVISETGLNYVFNKKMLLMK
jgi:hypothetical protein